MIKVSILRPWLVTGHQARRFQRLRLAAIVIGASGMLAACEVPAPPAADGTPAVEYIAAKAGRIAEVCAVEGFEAGAVRSRLIAEGFVEEQRFGGPQLEYFPDGAGVLTHGIGVPSQSPCSMQMNARFAREAVDAAGTALIAAGYLPTTNPAILARGTTRVRLEGRSPALGGIATISMEVQP